MGPSVQTGVTVGATCRSQLFALWSLAVEARRGRATVAVNLESGACWCGAERGEVALFRIRLLLLKAVLASKAGIQIILEEELTVCAP